MALTKIRCVTTTAGQGIAVHDADADGELKLMAAGKFIGYITKTTARDFALALLEASK